MVFLQHLYPFSLHVSVTAFTYQDFQRYPYLSIQFCPSSINNVGDNPSTWPLVHNMDTFLDCSHIPRLFTAGLNISVHNTHFYSMTSLHGSTLSLPAGYEGPKDTRHPISKSNITMDITEDVTPGQAISATIEMTCRTAPTP